MKNLFFRLVIIVSLAIIGSLAEMVNAEEIDFIQWKSLLEKEKTRSTLLDLSADENFYIALYSNGENFTSACFWFKHGYKNLIRDSVIINLKNGEKINWSHDGADIPLNFNRGDKKYQYFAGYSGSVLLSKIESITISVTAAKNLVEYQIEYSFANKGDAFQSTKLTFQKASLPKE